jgi:DNA-binding IclR family transcriptional regulator
MQTRSAKRQCPEYNSALPGANQDGESLRKRTNYKTSKVKSANRRDPFPGDRQFVGALHRGLEILRCFRPTDTSLGNQDLAKRSSLPKATVSRLTYTLSKLGYLTYLSNEGKYRLGVPVLGLGYSCLGGLKIRELVQPHLQELADFAGDGALIALGARDDLTMTYIACARSAGVISLQLSVGSRISLARSSIGRAYLSGLGDEEREALMERMREHYGEEGWPPIRKGILRSLQEIRAHGYCLNFGDWHPHINAVAVPFRTKQADAPVLAVNCGGPSSVLSAERLKKTIAPRLVDVVRRVATYAGVDAARVA